MIDGSGGRKEGNAEKLAIAGSSPFSKLEKLKG
jgi:hypothetical protein